MLPPGKSHVILQRVTRKVRFITDIEIGFIFWSKNEIFSEFVQKNQVDRKLKLMTKFSASNNMAKVFDSWPI